MTNDILGSANTLGAPNLDGTLPTGLTFENSLAPNFKFVGADRIGSFINDLSSNLVVQDLTASSNPEAALADNLDLLTGSDRVRRDKYDDQLRAALIRFGYKGITFKPKEPSAENVAIVKIDPLTGSRTVNGQINDDLPVVSYELGIRDTSTLSATLGGLKADVDLSLWQDRNNDGLFDPDEELDFSEEEGNASEGIVRNLFPGKYVLDVYQFEGNTEFKLDLQSTPVVTPAGAIGLTLTNAASVGTLGGGTVDRSGTLAPGKVDLYRFNIGSSREFGVFLENTSAPATVELFRDLNNNGQIDNGEMLESASATVGQSGDIYYPQQDAGNYLVRVSSSANTNYSLSFDAPGSSRTGAEVIPAMGLGETLSNSITATDALNPNRPGARVKEFTLTDVVGNQQVNIAVNGSTGFDPAVQIIDESTGQVVAENDNSSPNTRNAAIAFTAEDNTTYTVRVTSFASGVAALGDFTVQAAGSATVAGNLAFGQTLGGSLTNSSILADSFYRADYALTGLNPGQAVQLNLDSTAFDAYLEVVEVGSGRIVADNDDISFPNNTNSRLTFTPAAGVNYLARVSTSLENQTGAFSISALDGRNTVARARPSLPAYLGAIKSEGLRSAIATRAEDEVLDRADFLALYTTIASDNTLDANEVADLKTLSRETDAFSVSEPVRYLASKVATDAAEPDVTAASFTSNIVGNWFLGQVRPAAYFQELNDNNTALKQTVDLEYKAFAGTLYNKTTNSPLLGELAQGSWGNCYYIATLGAMFGQVPIEVPTGDGPFPGQKTASPIQNAVTDNGDNTYTVRFFHPTTKRAEYVTVDNFFVTREEESYGVSRFKTPDNAGNILWPIVMERAYAQWLDTLGTTSTGTVMSPPVGGGVTRPWGGYDRLANGGFGKDSQEHLLGAEATKYTDEDRQFGGLQQALAQGKTATGGVEKNGLLYGGHAYTITNAFTDSEGNQVVDVFNPHGRDNGGEGGVSAGASEKANLRTTPSNDDGFVRLSWEEFLQAFPDYAVL
ncbi:MAG: hypothetical protein EA001_06675 [Oscillatoriales cyanobacterium]|nr:MAG: hypothetical protein EA001_06675 [Oscillatoriales cyanobacterium]